uniref:Homeobox domain-containing protein n=1 Tax=Globodera pallida TaxID=36090 RepID=A0A183BJ48_GLOPA
MPQKNTTFSPAKMNVGTAQGGDGAAPCRPPPSTVIPGPDSAAFCKRKKKRVRTVYSGWQLAALEAQFRVQQYLVGEQRVRFAEQLELNQTQVKVWFQNRRIRFRRDQWATKVQKDTVANASTAKERTGTKQFE